MENLVREIVRDVNDLAVFLDNVYNINCGGCCFFASCIARYLEELNIPYSVAFYDSSINNDDAVEIYQNIKNRNDLGTPNGYSTCNHYTLKVDDVVLNSLDHLDDDYVVVDDISCEDLDWIYENGSWNSSYDTKYNVAIEDYINNLFKKYEEDKKRKESNIIGFEVY